MSVRRSHRHPCYLVDTVVWNLTKSPNTNVSDRQSVPFLPVNPDFSSTRNQGRQKLARFNAREFATLIIDILSDAKRRQVGSVCSPGPEAPGIADWLIVRYKICYRPIKSEPVTCCDQSVIGSTDQSVLSDGKGSG